MEKANAAILGVDSAESGHSADDGDSAHSDAMEEYAETNAEDGPEVNAADGAVAFQFYGSDEEGDKEDEEVAAANAGVAEYKGVNAAIACGVNEATAAHSVEAPTLACCPPSLPAFISSGLSNVAGSAVLSLASQGGRGHRNVVPTPRKSPTSSSFNSSLVGVDGGKTKISTNHKRGLISKAMERMAQSTESGGRESGGNMMVSMMSVQMQQQAQHFAMQQHMFQQQIQMQMAAMEKRAETSEKYLHRIARKIGHSKCKRGDDDDENDSSDDNK